MTNPFYTPTGYPAIDAASAPASALAEFQAIATGFGLLPTLGAGSAGQLVHVSAFGTTLEAAGGVKIDSSGALLPLVTTTKPFAMMAGPSSASYTSPTVLTGYGYVVNQQGNLTASTVNGRLTVPVAGRYRVWAAISIQASLGTGAAATSIVFQMNGSDLTTPGYAVSAPAGGSGNLNDCRLISGTVLVTVASSFFTLKLSTGATVGNAINILFFGAALVS